MNEYTREHLTTQKIYPNVNNNDLLEFRIPPNAKGHLDLSNVLLHFVVTVPSPEASVKIKPQNFLGPKQFSTVEIRINGEAVTRRSCSNEYFLTSYFHNLCNYSTDYQRTALRPVGIFDYTHATTVEIAAYATAQAKLFENSRTNIVDQSEYEIIMPIDSTLFLTEDLLPSNTSLDLSFERMGAGASAILFAPTTMPSSVNNLKDVYLIAPFKKDENLFRMERNAIEKPLKIHFDDYVVRRFNLKSGSASIIMTDIINGPLPSKLFWGLQSIDSYTGTFTESSTRFNRQDLVKANLYIDGKEANDFPVTMSEKHVSLPFVKFLENTNKQQNGLLSTSISLIEFENSNFILSATLDPLTSGSLSFEFNFHKAVAKDLVLVTCGVYEKTLKLGHNRNFQVV